MCRRAQHGACPGACPRSSAAAKPVADTLEVRAAPAGARPESGTASRRLLAAEVAPGVVVAIDPARVADPAALLDRLARALTSTSQRSHGEPE